MENEILDKYRLAGKITAKARDVGKALIKDGVSYIHREIYGRKWCTCSLSREYSHR